MKLIKIPIFASILLFSLSCKKKSHFDKSDHVLPRLELTINESYLWAPSTGLYIIGKNGAPNGCSSMLANYNQKWEYPCYIEYFVNNNLAFSDNVGFRIKGNCSRALPMKSIGFYWRSEYGNSKLNYSLFKESQVNDYKRIVLRNSGNDFAHTHMKDAVNSNIVRGFSNVDLQNYQPCILYINDVYWGIHNIREMITPRFFQYLYGVNPDNVDLLEFSETNVIVDDGSADDFNSDVIDFLKNNDVSNSTNYNLLAQQMDINSYMDYIIIETYIANTDWPNNNTKWWREKTSSQYNKWRWILHDTDNSLDKKMVKKAWIGDLYKKGSFNESRNGGFFIFNHLLKNIDFKTAFLNRYMYYINNIYNPERTTKIIRKMQSRLYIEYPHHSDFWKTTSPVNWIKKIDEMTDFFSKRSTFMKKEIQKLIDEL